MSRSWPLVVSLWLGCSHGVAAPAPSPSPESAPLESGPPKVPPPEPVPPPPPVPISLVSSVEKMNARLNTISCRAPAARFCAPSACDDSQVASVRSLMQEARGACTSTDQAFYAEGTCGSLRYVAWGTGFVGGLLYLDDHSRVVAGYKYSDGGEYCNGTSHSMRFGTTPHCTHVERASRCDEDGL